MPLDDYKAKRDFDRTPEPAGEAAPSAGVLRFVVQKHDATRLHYDFRLELDGVLKSWAVPKGPSLDPSVKRLAVETEDHPMDYADFEGVIPAGEYGGGPVVVWDHGTWVPDGDPREGYAEGKLEFRLEGEKLQGGWRLVRTRRTEGKRESWLLMKRNDAAAERGQPVSVVDARPRSVISGRTIEEVAAGVPQGAQQPSPSAVPGARRGPLPERISPQLATLVDAAPEGAWLQEVKLDGYRLLARRQGSSITLYTRKGLDWTGRFPAVARAVARLPVEEVLLDGEIVVLDRSGRSSFEALQQALGDPDAPFVYFAFDLLHVDGWDLRGAPLRARKEVLRRLLESTTGPLRYTDHIAGRPADFLREACELGLEGMICKDPDARYESRRSRSWLKVRCQQRQELVIVGFTEPSGKREGLGALLLGVRDDGTLRYAGKVGTGFTERTLRELYHRLRPLERDRAPVADPPREAGVHWVEPRLVAEVAFTEWTRDGRIRHPSFQGLREDKAPAEVVRERPAPAPRPRKTGPPKVGGVTLSSPDKALWPDAGITKLELARTYEALAPRMLPGLLHRPLTLYRCPEGLGGACFFQKHDKMGMPDALQRVRFFDDDEPYLAVTDMAGLISLVQIGVLEIHVHGMRTDRLDRPDVMVLDLDPGPGVSWGRVAATALILRERLDALGLVPFVRATGGKGLHVVVPLVRRSGWDEVKGFAHDIARWFARREPDLYTSKLAKDQRGGRIFIDYLRNTHKSTAIASWSTRARPGAPMAVPLAWSEVDPGAEGPPVIGLREVLDRDDPWVGYDEAARGITKAMREAVAPPRDSRRR